MNFKDLAAQVLMSKINSANNSDDAASALDKLAAGRNGFDLREIVGRFQSSRGDVAGKLKSWLGDGSNESISASQVKDAIGSDKIASFARKLGIDRDAASAKLAQILPELIDRSSQGGKLIGSIAGKRTLSGFTSRFLRKSA